MNHRCDHLNSTEAPVNSKLCLSSVIQIDVRGERPFKQIGFFSNLWVFLMKQQQQADFFFNTVMGLEWLPV